MGSIEPRQLRESTDGTNRPLLHEDDDSRGAKRQKISQNDAGQDAVQMRSSPEQERSSPASGSSLTNSASHRRTHISKLPAAVTARIFSYCDNKTVLSLNRTSKLLYYRSLPALYTDFKPLYWRGVKQLSHCISKEGMGPFAGDRKSLARSIAHLIKKMDIDFGRLVRLDLQYTMNSDSTEGCDSSEDSDALVDWDRRFRRIKGNTINGLATVIDQAKCLE